MENGFYSDIAGGLRKSALEIVGVFCNILDTRFKMVHYLIKKKMPQFTLSAIPFAVNRTFCSVQHIDGTLLQCRIIVVSLSVPHYS